MKKEKYLKPMCDFNGLYVILEDRNGKKCKRYVHELVAEAFVPNPNNYKNIEHIDGNKLNNNANNLRWVK